MPEKAPKPVPEVMNTVKDPFGHCWAIASLKWVLTPKEIKAKQEEWQKSLDAQGG